MLICSFIYAFFYSARITPSKQSPRSNIDSGEKYGCQPTWVQISALPLTGYPAGYHWASYVTSLCLRLPALERGNSGVYLIGTIVTIEGAHICKAPWCREKAACVRAPCWVCRGQQSTASPFSPCSSCKRALRLEAPGSALPRNMREVGRRPASGEGVWEMGDRHGWRLSWAPLS